MINTTHLPPRKRRHRRKHASIDKRVRPKGRNHSCGLARRVDRSKAKTCRHTRALEQQTAEGMEQRRKASRRRTGAAKYQAHRLAWLEKINEAKRASRSGDVQVANGASAE